MRKNRLYLSLLLIVMVLLSACSSAGAIPADAILDADTNTYGEIFYYYGVVQSDGSYYVRVLRAYKDAPTDADYLYVPLADQIDASFQENGHEGAWSPIAYRTAEELAAGDRDGKITIGAKFSSGITGGRMDYLAEENHYAGMDNPS